MEAIISSIASIVLLIGGLLYKTALNKVVGSFFVGKSAKEIRKMSVFILIGVVFIMNIPLIIESNSGNGNKDLPLQPPPKAESKSKSETEVYMEIGEKVLNAASTGLKNAKENKIIKDSILISNKSDLWVYQIGLANSDKDIVWNKYKQLEDDGSIYVFEKDRNTLFLIKDEGKSKQVLENEKLQFENAISNIESRVEIINLATLCKAKQNIISSTDIKVKRKTFMKCRVCG